MLLASSAYDDQEIVKLKAELVAIRAQYDSLLEASLQQIAGRSNETPKTQTAGGGKNSPITSSSTNLHKHFTNSPTTSISSTSLSKLDGDSPREKDDNSSSSSSTSDSKGGKKKVKGFINKIISSKGKEREREPSLEQFMPSAFTLTSPSTSYQDLPRLQVNTLASRKHILLSGPAPRQPNEPEDELGLSSHDDVAAGRSISTYPILPGSGRMGDPIADCFKAHVFENRVIACIADGCAWGVNARDAAQKANNGFVEYVDEHNNNITDVKQAGEVLLHALEHAHNSIIEGKPGAGQTTIIGGVLLELNKVDSFTPPWEFICASVGDCKAFWFGSNGDIADITKGNRKNTSDVRDSGGFLGPDAAGKPDLQNLNLFCQPCYDGDLIILMTDGAHDNLDPQLLGKLPSDMSKEFNLIGEKWEDVDPVKATNAKNVYSTELLKMLILKGTDEDHPPTPTEVTNRLVDYCISVTQKSRDWFAKNQDKRMPENHLELPGKMDHTTCLCFKVGRYTGLPDSPGLPRQWQTVTSPYVARVQL